MSVFGGSQLEKTACVFIGTSITAIRPSDGIQALDTFCARISNARGYKRWINAGVGGDTTTLMLARFATDVLWYRPAMVAIEVGPNDEFSVIPIATSESNIRNMVAAAQKSGARVTLIVPFYLRDNGTHNTPTEAWRVLTRNLAAELGCELFDVAAVQAALPGATLDTLYLPADAYHFTATGQAWIADQAALPQHQNAFNTEALPG